MGFNRQAYEQERFNARSRDYCYSNLKVMTLWSVYSPSMIFVGSLGSVIILWFGTGEVMAGTLTVGELVAFLSYLALFYVPVNQIHSVNHMLQHALAAGERVFEIIDTQPEVADRPGAVEPAGRLRGQVVARDVSFHYRPDIPGLKHGSFEGRAGGKEFIIGLRKKDDRWVGERGVKLPVGQKQRFSIAGALLKDPPIIIFDEATSNIDTETEVKIREALAELTRNRTTFIIAHRLSTLRHVDRIFVLDQGRLIEEGTHEALLARSGLYRTLYEAQFQL